MPVPELPEVESLARSIEAKAKGRTVARVELAAISALKTYDPPLDALVGRTLQRCDRRGKFLILDFDGIYLVTHLARAGWLKWRESFGPATVKLTKGPMALRVRLDDGTGFDLTEAGTDKRLSVHVVRDPQEIEHLATLGPDPLDDSFDLRTFASLLKSQGKSQVKGVLVDQRVIAGVGNAYSDEALHVAKLSPFKPASSLDDDDVARLHAALVGVLQEALRRSDGVDPSGLKGEKKSGLRVHGRKGEPCPECGDTVREVSFSTKALQYCATCQTGGKPLADRRMSKLLK